MGSDKIIVKEYLESLKEDKELDYLFPILLNIMGYKIISTAKESKGQNQYGKDIVAIRTDENGIRFRCYFELKGYSDRDITDQNYSATDGIRESILEAKDTAFNDSSIPEFNSLPVKVILVHNGIIKQNIRPTFEGLISREFKENEFERWDIYHLTDLFSGHFFNEYLLTDEESLRLFKRCLVLLDAPANDFFDFKKLVDLQIKKIGTINSGRAYNKFFATQGLLASVVYHYSKENNNLEPAKNCLSYLLLKTWGWVLENKLEKKSAVRESYAKLVSIHYNMLDSYFKTTLPVALLENGLHSERGSIFEEVGYPLRCFEYLNYFTFYCESRLFFPTFSKSPSQSKARLIRRKQKDIIITLIENNDGCSRPLMDYHSIAILNVFLFFLREDDLSEDDKDFLAQYIITIFDNIAIIKHTRGRFPLLSSSELPLIKSAAKKEKVQYEDRSSLLITILFELAAIMDIGFIHENYSDLFKELNLQTAYPNTEEYNIEELLFGKHFHDEFYVETSIPLESSLSEFRTSILAKDVVIPEYRTDKSGFKYLRILAHIYFKNEFFTDEWRRFYARSEPT